MHNVWDELIRQQQKATELMPKVAAAFKRLRELKALKDMKITDDTWELPFTSKGELDELVSYAKSCGVLIDKQSGEFYRRTNTSLWYAHDGLHTSEPDGEAQIITVAQFKAMCDEYAAEKANNSIGIKPALTVGQALGLDRGEFYCLMEGGTTPPTVTHPTLEAAKVEAHRLIEAHNKPVRILRAMLEIKPAGRYIETQL